MPPPASRPFWFQGLGDQRHHLVAVHQRAVLVDDDHPVRVAVQRDADVGAHLVHLPGHRHRVGGAAFLVDVEAVGLVVDGDDLGAQLPERGGRHLVAGAVGAVDNDPQARQRHGARQRPLGELDIAVMHAVDALGSAEPILVGERHLHLAVEHSFDAPLDLVGQLVAVQGRTA